METKPYTHRQFISFLRKFKLPYTNSSIGLMIKHPYFFGITFKFEENYIVIHKNKPYNLKISVYTTSIVRFLKWTQKSNVINWKELGIQILETDKSPV